MRRSNCQFLSLSLGLILIFGDGRQGFSSEIERADFDSKCSNVLLESNSALESESSIALFGIKTSKPQSESKSDVSKPVDLSVESSSLGFDDLNYAVSIRNMVAGGIGYHCGYSSLVASFAPFTFSSGYNFYDARVHVLNNGDFASNLGTGFRFNLPKNSGVLGVNGFYDYRNSKFGYNQLGCGLDYRMGRFLFSANGYFPIKNAKHLDK